jgi:hypothetical protein
MCLCLGSSIKVTPAADVPATVAEKPGATLAIVNLQATPLDDAADVVVSAPVDDVMRVVMARLGIDVPPFRECVPTHAPFAPGGRAGAARAAGGAGAGVARG